MLLSIISVCFSIFWGQISHFGQRNFKKFQKKIQFKNNNLENFGPFFEIKRIKLVTSTIPRYFLGRSSVVAALCKNTST
jgi:hypothetical protein